MLNCVSRTWIHFIQTLCTVDLKCQCQWHCPAISHYNVNDDAFFQCHKIHMFFTVLFIISHYIVIEAFRVFRGLAVCSGRATEQYDISNLFISIWCELLWTIFERYQIYFMYLYMAIWCYKSPSCGYCVRAPCTCVRAQVFVGILKAL